VNDFVHAPMALGKREDDLLRSVAPGT
jgi:hypothetical protein